MIYALKQRETILANSELVEGKLETISELGRLCGQFVTFVSCRKNIEFPSIFQAILATVEPEIWTVFSNIGSLSQEVIKSVS